MRGSPVTVLANATELFSNIDASMPKFSDWLQQGMGINSSATLEVRGRCSQGPQLQGCSLNHAPCGQSGPATQTRPRPPRAALALRPPCLRPTHVSTQEYGRLWMPMPSNTTNGYDSHVVCTMHYGYTYFLQMMFIILCVIVLFQVRSSRWAGG